MSQTKLIRKFARRGHYLLFRLIKVYGPNAELVDWPDVISSDCPKKIARSMNDRCGAKCPQLPKVLYAAEGQQIFSFVFFGFADLADAKKIQRQCLWEWPMPGDDGGIPTRTCGMDGYLQLLTEEYTRYGVQMMPLVAGIMLVWVGYLKRIRISGPVPEASSI